jgi:putative heme transporter
VERLRTWPAWLWRTGLVVVVLAGGLWTATHGVAHVGWAEVGHILRRVTPGQLVVLAVIWLGGLAIYSLVLSAALPGLGIRRSLLLNLSGSAVSNVVPLGGALGTALNWRMVTRWGHSNSAFVAFCVLTNVLDVLTKLALPVVAVAALAVVSTHVPTVLWVVACCCAVALLGAVLAGPLVGRVYAGWLRVREVLRDHGPRMVAASAGYIAAQVALLDVSLHTVGLHPPLTVVVMAAAIERLGTLVPITPGGTGVAEIGAVAWLVASGLSPVEVVAGVLLCRVFLVVMEIPVGGALLAGWAWTQRAARPRPAPRVVG